MKNGSAGLEGEVGKSWLDCGVPDFGKTMELLRSGVELTTVKPCNQQSNLRKWL